MWKCMMGVCILLVLTGCLNGFVAAKTFWRNPDGTAVTNCQGDPIHLNHRWQYHRFASQDAQGMVRIRCPDANRVQHLFE